MWVSGSTIGKTSITCALITNHIAVLMSLNFIQSCLTVNGSQSTLNTCCLPTSPDFSDMPLWLLGRSFASIQAHQKCTSRVHINCKWGTHEHPSETKNDNWDILWSHGLNGHEHAAVIASQQDGKYLFGIGPITVCGYQFSVTSLVKQQFCHCLMLKSKHVEDYAKIIRCRFIKW